MANEVTTESLSTALKHTDRLLRRVLRYASEANPDPSEDVSKQLRRAKRQLRTNSALLGEESGSEEAGG